MTGQRINMQSKQSKLLEGWDQRNIANNVRASSDSVLKDISFHAPYSGQKLSGHKTELTYHLRFIMLETDINKHVGAN
jgi:hypothetical protein